MYDVVLTNCDSTDCLSLNTSLDECIAYIRSHNGVDDVPIFLDYKGGVASVVEVGANSFEPLYTERIL